MIPKLALLLLTCQSTLDSTDVGLFAKSLWFLQAYGQTDCCRADNDRRLKDDLALAVAKDREIAFQEINQWISQPDFDRFAGDDGRLTESEISMALDQAIPDSRKRLHPELQRHADLLTTSFDMIDPSHRPAMEQLADWIARNNQQGKSLHVIVTCTGNSRRSVLSASLGNLAAQYYGFDRVHFHSGGTIPSAFNKRTIATLRDIGFQIEPTGEEATRGDPLTPNAKYRVTIGSDREWIEFSKTYRDQSNPQQGFAAIMVCNEADESCPTVEGAALRLSMTFVDPKLYDDGILEKSKYAERRDDIGRTFLAIMADARRRSREMPNAAK